MSRRANKSGIRLSDHDAAIVKGMLLRGDRVHDIAAWFGVNGGRIGDISTGREFSWVRPALAEALPPPGPYFPGKLMTDLAEAQQLIASLRAA